MKAETVRKYAAKWAAFNTLGAYTCGHLAGWELAGHWAASGWVCFIAAVVAWIAIGLSYMPPL